MRRREAPRRRADFDAALERGRERLYAAVEEVSVLVAGWFKEAGELRQTLDDARVRLMADAAEETRRHLRWLLDPKLLQNAPLDWLRQLSRYLKAEQRRWQRNTVRGNEPAHIGAELSCGPPAIRTWPIQLAAEVRWTPLLDEFRFWIEEYRVSLYAQELKTLGPVSAARLEQRAAEIEAWLRR